MIIDTDYAGITIELEGGCWWLVARLGSDYEPIEIEYTHRPTDTDIRALAARCRERIASGHGYEE